MKGRTLPHTPAVTDGSFVKREMREEAMTFNARIDALIARLKDGEKLDTAISNAVADAVDPPLRPGTILERQEDSSGFPVWRVKHPGQGWGSWYHGDDYAQSIDAVLVLARNQYEVWRLLESAAIAIEDCQFSGDIESQPANPEPVLRAMLVEALNRRRT